MGHKVVTLVYSRLIGSPHRKAIVAYMADRASDDGSGVYCSKGTIALETEIARSTVFKIIKDLVEEGVLIEVGNRPCKNGATVIYDMNLEAISAFPMVKPGKATGPGAGLVRGVTSPGAGPHQSGSRTPTSPAPGPKPSLEPPLNQEEEEGARAKPVDLTLISKLTHALGFDHHGQVPRYWMQPDAPLIVARWQSDLGLTSEEVIAVAVGNMRAHGSPANGPKTLTRHMQDFAAAKQAPRLEPTKGNGHVQPSRQDRGAAAQSDATGRAIAFAARARRSPGPDCF